MKKLALGALSALLVFSFISCGSKKPAEEEKKPEAPVVTEEKVEEVVEETADEVVEEIKTVDNTIAFEAVSNTRQLAMDSGAEDYAYYYLVGVDNLYDEIKEKSDNGEDTSAECADLAKRYDALCAYTSALKAKEIIDDTEMYTISQSVYDKGCAALEETERLFDDPNATGQQILDKATEASVSLNGVLVLVYKRVARDERDAAFDAKKDADSVKAGVAQKDKYKEAVEYFKKGDQLYSVQSTDKAYESYKTAKEMFIELYTDIADKRAAALAAIEEAKKRVEESAAFAENADNIAPLTEKVAGIEDEDAVLLEEDNYEDPANAEAELDEELKEASLKDQLEGAAKNINDFFEGDAK